MRTVTGHPASGGNFREGRIGGGAQRQHVRATVAKRAAVGQRSRWQEIFQRAAPMRARRQPQGSAARRTATPGYKDEPARRTAPRMEATSTNFPKYITITRWLKCLTTARLWLMNSIAMPISCCKSSNRLMICPWIGHIERTDRFIANQEFRVQHRGAGDADSLALAAAEFMRVAARHVGAQAHALQNRRDFFTPRGRSSIRARISARVRRLHRPPSCADSGLRADLGTPFASCGAALASLPARS